MTDPFAALDATAQADLVRQGQVTPREMVEAAIARIERLTPTPSVPSAESAAP